MKNKISTANMFFGTDAMRIIDCNKGVQGTAFAQAIAKKLDTNTENRNLVRLSKDGGYSVYVTQSKDMKKILGSVQASIVLPEKDKSVLAVARAILELDKLGARDLLLLANKFEGFVPLDWIGSDLVGIVKMTINNNGKGTQAVVQANIAFMMENTTEVGDTTYHLGKMNNDAVIPINDDLIGTFNEIYVLGLPATRRIEEAFNKHENKE